MTGHSSPTAQARTPTRRWILIGCLVIAVLAVGVTVGLALGGGDPGSDLASTTGGDDGITYPPSSPAEVTSSPLSMGIRPSGPALPLVDPGFATAATATGDRAALETVELFGGQIRACWTVSGTLQRLRVGLGSSLGLIDADAEERAGCVFAPASAGNTQMRVEFLGAGIWTVRLDEQGRTDSNVIVPALRDATEPTAVQQLQAEGLGATRSTGCVRSEGEGVVLSQKPAAGSVAVRGSTVAVTYNRRLRVPDLAGTTRPQAAAKIKAAGLVPSVTELSLPDGEKPKPLLYQQLPAPGEIACPDDTVVAEFEA